MSGFTRRDCKWDGRSHELTEMHPLTGGSSPIRPHRQLKSKRAARAMEKGDLQREEAALPGFSTSSSRCWAPKREGVP